MDKNTNYVKIKAAPRKREELTLTPLYYISVDPFRADSWDKVLGVKPFLLWLKLQTLVDRTDEAEKKYGNRYTVPRSIVGLAKLLDMGKNTLYSHLKILWDYALIEFEPWESQQTKGQKAINIIVFPYPQGKIELSYQPLIKIRDYDKDYTSEARNYSLKHSKKHKDKVNQSNKQEQTTPVDELTFDYSEKWAHDILLDELKKIGITEQILKEIEVELANHPEVVIPIGIANAQLVFMQDKLEVGETIFDFAKYFVGGAVKRVSVHYNVDTVKANFEQRVKDAEIYQPNPNMFYNWLVERE